jgi:hypothetical protein
MFVEQYFRMGSLSQCLILIALFIKLQATAEICNLCSTSTCSIGFLCLRFNAFEQSSA